MEYGNLRIIRYLRRWNGNGGVALFRRATHPIILSIWQMSPVQGVPMRYLFMSAVDAFNPVYAPSGSDRNILSDNRRGSKSWQYGPLSLISKLPNALQLCIEIIRKLSVSFGFKFSGDSIKTDFMRR